MSKHILRVGNQAHGQAVEMALHAGKTPTQIAEQAIAEMHGRWAATMRMRNKQWVRNGVEQPTGDAR